MAIRVCFPEQGAVSIEDFDPGHPGPGQVRVRSLVSLISNGTEGIILNRRFAPGTHWDGWFQSKGGYPWYPGYALVGEVVAVGEGVELALGSRVGLRSGHASEVLVAATDCLPLPADLDPVQAAWFALAKITCLGALAAGAVFGEPVVVIGAGPIGQMAMRWLRDAGAQPLVCIDPVEARLEHARRIGAIGIAGDVADVGEAVKQATGGGAAVVVDATGNARVFTAALGMARFRGTVVLLGDTGTPSEQRLTGDIIAKGLRVVGAHDGHAIAPWTERRIVDLFTGMVSAGRMDMSGLTTHVIPARRAPEAYAAMRDEPQRTLGIALDWRGA
jgi:2-desacetyl-2-hydroxyethyl bacteriochlorophyllide A dehydrogenase